MRANHSRYLQRYRELLARGIPMDPVEECFESRALLATQRGGPATNTIFDLPRGGAGIILDLSIAFQTRGLITVCGFDVCLPWESSVVWLEDPRECEGQTELYRLPGTQIEYPRHLVLNHRLSSSATIKFGRPISGLVLGWAVESTPEQVLHDPEVRFVVTDELGAEHSTQLRVWVDQTMKTDRVARQQRRGSLYSDETPRFAGPRYAAVPPQGSSAEGE